MHPMWMVPHEAGCSDVAGLRRACTARDPCGVPGPQLGLVDGVAPRERLLADARQLAADIAAGTKPRVFSLYRCAPCLTASAARPPSPA